MRRLPGHPHVWSHSSSEGTPHGDTHGESWSLGAGVSEPADAPAAVRNKNAIVVASFLTRITGSNSRLGMLKCMRHSGFFHLLHLFQTYGAKPSKGESSSTMRMEVISACPSYPKLPLPSNQVIVTDENRPIGIHPKLNGYLRFMPLRAVTRILYRIPAFNATMAGSA